MPQAGDRGQVAQPTAQAQNKVQGSNKDHVFIFDTTLRDGEQCPGATMTFEEKLEVADFLDAMGVDIIEAGFPIASEGDFAAVSEIAKRLQRSVVAGLCRAGEADIDRAGEAVKHARRPRIHTFIATSPVHRKNKLQKSAEDRPCTASTSCRSRPRRCWSSCSSR
jgi:2-isopropylmalate synthase